VSNAVKFTDSGNVAVTASASTRAEVSRIRVEVKDTGIGVDEETLARLFQPFTQADNSTARRYGGTGLGLTISARLVEAMGGTIGAKSEPGRGSTFWLEIALPLAEASDRPAPAVSDLDLAALPAHGDVAPLILVAEDNPVNQILAARMLERLGYAIELVGDGRQAVAAVKRTRYAAVLMDCQMPELDGYQATEEIRRGERPGEHVPMIAMTANSMPGDREKCLAAGMDDYISKPVRARDLLDTLTRHASIRGEHEPVDPPELSGPGRPAAARAG